jgi:hypothetical protein
MTKETDMAVRKQIAVHIMGLEDRKYPAETYVEVLEAFSAAVPRRS